MHSQEGDQTLLPRKAWQDRGKTSIGISNITKIALESKIAQKKQKFQKPNPKLLRDTILF